MDADCQKRGCTHAATVDLDGDGYCQAHADQRAADAEREREQREEDDAELAAGRRAFRARRCNGCSEEHGLCARCEREHARLWPEVA